MPRGYRCIILAAAGWLILAAAPQHGRNGKSDQAAAQPDIAAELKRIAAAIEKPPEAEQPDTGCQTGKDDRQSDLCAQWKAADAAAEAAAWARPMFLLGIAGAVVGAFTLLAAGVAAWYARKAALYTADNVIEAKRAAQAAEDALTESRKAKAQQLRPYVAFTDSPNRKDPVPLARDGKIELAVRNFGQIPA